jgi:ATP-dependent DNA ligase
MSHYFGNTDHQETDTPHPILYQKGKGGAIFTWKVWTEGKNVCTEYGQIDGKKQVAKYEAKPTNVGRSNERNAEAQAAFEAKALWQNKLDRKYSETMDEANEQLMLPMLAHKFEDRNKKLKYPVDAQPKLDGVRCLARWDGKRVVLLSRSGKEYNVPHIVKALEPFFKSNKKSVLDGELYVHGIGLQAINRLVKKNREGSEAISYNIYDMPTIDGDSKLPWEARLSGLKLATPFTSNENDLVIVETVEAKDADEVEKLRLKFVKQGYEGAIVRAKAGMYSFGHRSADLLKVKAFVDSEFKIVDVEEGVGKMKGCAVFVCEAKKGLTFKVVMKTSMEERAEIWKDRKNWIGKMLVVKYQFLTEDGIPFLPVGLAERMEEDN